LLKKKVRKMFEIIKKVLFLQSQSQRYAGQKKEGLDFGKLSSLTYWNDVAKKLVKQE